MPTITREQVRVPADVGPEARETYIDNYLAATRGTTCVWCYAPGYVYPDRLDVAGIREVTGFEARPISPYAGEPMRRSVP